MKLERTERLQAHTKGKRFSCFLYADRAHDLGDAVFVGAEDGKVSAFWLLENSSKISFVRETDLGKDEEAGTVGDNDPLDVIESSGTDALRYTLATGTSSRSPRARCH